MTDKVMARPGGRSARIQQAVHEAVRRLQAQSDSLSVPLVARTAGVTPSTIYRRWGTLNELLADVALARLRPDAVPKDTGTLRQDLVLFASHYLEEMTSVPGRQMLRDIMASSDPTGRERCYRYARECLEHIVERAASRSRPEEVLEMGPERLLERLTDRLLAPLFYRVIYDARGVGEAQLETWIDEALAARDA
ncbi:TetR/AcrR family transcriptional regulator [Halomonas sp. THAF5a]|uniref:TetR/AcrR family transcriptional regulator n=1 Tax=Halomonas sp. THAF5a TaxID=2587844 RepID=UPI0012694D14|nr:TetR/AcrR family transcriptional regulator [Halomonas sp. THAF5a]